MIGPRSSQLDFAALLVVAVGACLWAPPHSARAEPVGEAEAADQDRPRPMEPDEAVKTLVVPPGFRMELVAAEPLVRDPMAMEFDENGYAYVLEIPSYNEYEKPGPRTPGSVARLEDSDGDGRFDRRTTFAGDLKYPTGLFCYGGGLFVGDPPDLLYLRDTDSDGTADEREVVLTGFGAAQAGETQLNSYRWGLDNRIHICTGLDGGEIRSGDQPNAAPREVRNRRILLEPRSRGFELTSGGGQHGMSFDDWGRVFVCDNSRPILRVFYDDRYIERNPLMSAPQAVIDIGPGSKFPKHARISGPDTWRRVRERLLREDVAVTDTYEWDRVAGVFTSATGITIYRGDALPKALRGNAFAGEVANNFVYRARLTTKGLGMTSQPMDGESGFLASTDTWFRPVQFAHGPDGNLYVIDMYRQLIEGIQWVPPEVVAQMDPTAGNERGRIYRVVRENFRQPPRIQLGGLKTEELVELLAHANSWHRETAARLLYERQDQRAVEPLRRMVQESSSPLGRLHALWALDGLQALDETDVLRTLDDEHPRLREHGLRLAERFARPSSRVAARLRRLVDDGDAFVRLQLAFSAGYLAVEQRNATLLALLQRDGADSWFQMAIQSSLSTGAAEFMRLVLEDRELRSSAQGGELLSSLMKQIGRSKRSDELHAAVKAIDDLSGDEQAISGLARRLVVAAMDEGAGARASQLAERSQGRVKQILEHLFIEARQTALDGDLDADLRLEAVSILSCGDFAPLRDVFDELLTPQEPQPIQQAVINALGRFSDAAVAELLLAKWAALTPALRASASEVLLSRPPWAEALLAAVEKGNVARADFDPARIALLKSHPSEVVRERAASVFSDSHVPQRADVLATYRTALELSGEVERGRAVFKKSCSACHELEGSGTAIGAELAGLRSRGAEAILLNILDPNREVMPNFLTYIVLSNDGRAITGIITEETPNNLTLRQADGSEVKIARGEVEEMKSTGVSYMPEGLEQEIDQQAMADLLAYLMSVKGKAKRAEGGK